MTDAVIDLSRPAADGPLLRQVIRLAWPVFVEQVLLYLVGLSDTLIAGRLLAVEQLAAVTVASYLMWFVGSLLVVVSTGATALVARRVGGGRRGEAILITHQAILLAWGVGIGLLAIGQLVAPAVVRLMNLDGAAAAEAVGYLRIALVALPLLACQSAGVACLRGAGDSRTGMWIMAIVNAVNVILSWVAAAGAFGLPQLGLRGVALGTAAAEIVGGLLVLGALAARRAGLSLSLAGLRPDRVVLREILRISLPAAGEGLTNSLCQLWFLGLINRLDETATAAHGVAIRCESIAFLTIAAFSVAASTLTGQNLGAGRPEEARRAVLLAWRLGVLVLGAIGILMLIFADSMFRLFLGPDQVGVAAQGIPALRLVALALPALATIVVLGGALRGAGATRGPWVVVALGYLLVRMPLTYLMAVNEPPAGLPAGLLGAWTAMFLDLHVRALLIWLWFRAGRWKSLRI